MTIEIDGEQRTARLLEALAMNGDYTAGGMWAAPEASPDDGLFDFVLIGAFSKAEFATTFPKIYRGRHIGHAKIEIIRGRTLSVESPTPLPIVLDGEQPGTTPLRIDMLPRARRCPAPSSRGRRRGLGAR
jgi:diacylglycerol kinase (ATP)